jgi:hypothetical protein
MRPLRVAALLFLVGASVASCIGHSRHVETAPSPSGHPYVALDYDKAGAPALSDGDKATIRSTLAHVKPCQRPLVRYTFPEGSSRMLMFFARPSDGPNAASHVFGRGNVFYIPAYNTAMVPPPDGMAIDGREAMAEGLKWDIDRQPCPRSTAVTVQIARTHPTARRKASQRASTQSPGARTRGNTPANSFS